MAEIPPKKPAAKQPPKQPARTAKVGPPNTLKRKAPTLGEPAAITPSRDEIDSFKRNQKKSSLLSSIGEVPDVASGKAAGSGTGIKVILALVVVLLIGTAALAGFLQQRLLQAERTIQLSEQRLQALERQLSVTDESMSESSVAMKVKIREMDKEIRKLWDNVWKKSKERFGKLEVQQKKYGNSISNSNKFIDSAEQRFVKYDKLMADLNRQLQDVSGLRAAQASAKTQLSRQETYIEKANDKLNRLNSDVLKQQRLAKDHGERLDAIDGWRRKANSDINALKTPSGG